MKIDNYFDDIEEEGSQESSEDENEPNFNSLQSSCENFDVDQRMVTRSMSKRIVTRNQDFKRKLEYDDWKSSVKAKRLNKQSKKEEPPIILKKPIQSQHLIYIWLVVILIIPLMAIYLLPFYFPLPYQLWFKSPTFHKSSPLAEFSYFFENKIKTKYNSLVSLKSWKVIKIAIDLILYKSSLNEKPLSPSVILLIGSERSSPVVRCLLYDLSHLISTVYAEKETILLSAATTNLNDINQKFEQTFKKNKLHSIILDGINQLKGIDALSLHQFTDHQFAPFSEAIIFLSAYTSSSLSNPNLELREIDRIANELLERSWISTLTADTISSILSRITSNVAIVLDSDPVKSIKCNLSQ